MTEVERKAPTEYATLLAEVKERVRSAQYAALRAVNKELIGLYWDLGRIICERQAGGGWGKSVVERLAADIRAEFPGAQGFSASNLWRMKGFFEAYVSSEKLAPLVREISWSHNILILERCADPLEREFYIRMTRKFGWSKSVLVHQIENQSYEKTLFGQIERPTAQPRGDHQAAGGGVMANGIVSAEVRLMKKAVVLLFALLTLAAALGRPAGTALAADTDPPAWAQGTVTVTGTAATSDDPSLGLGERRLAAQREAKLDAVKKLTELVCAIDTGAGVTVGALIAANETLRGPVDAFVQGARLTGTRFLPTGRAEATLEIGLEALPTILGIGDSPR